MILAPRRGSKTTMETVEKSSIVLAEGEVFFEVDRLLGIVRIKMGDGETEYGDLPYATGNTAEDTIYDPTESNLIANNAQAAIDNLAAIVHGITQIKLTAEYTCYPGANTSITFDDTDIDPTQYIPIGIAGYDTGDTALMATSVGCLSNGNFGYQMNITNTADAEINSTATLLVSVIPIN